MAEEDEEDMFEEWGDMISDEEVTRTTTTGERESTAKDPEEWIEQYEEEMENAQELFDWVKEKQQFTYNGEDCFAIPIEHFYEMLKKKGFYNPSESTEELEGLELQEKLKTAIPPRIYRIFGSAGKWRPGDVSKALVRTVEGISSKREEGEYLLMIYPDYFEDAYGETKWERFIAGKQRAYTRKFQGDSLARTIKSRCDLSDEEISPEFIENVNKKIIKEGMGQDYEEEKQKMKEKQEEEEEEEEEGDG